MTALTVLCHARHPQVEHIVDASRPPGSSGQYRLQIRASLNKAFKQDDTRQKGWTRIRDGTCQQPDGPATRLLSCFPATELTNVSKSCFRGKHNAIRTFPTSRPSWLFSDRYATWIDRVMILSYIVCSLATLAHSF